MATSQDAWWAPAQARPGACAIADIEGSPSGRRCGSAEWVRAPVREDRRSTRLRTAAGPGIQPPGVFLPAVVPAYRRPRRPEEGP